MPTTDSVTLTIRVDVEPFRRAMREVLATTRAVGAELAALRRLVDRTASNVWETPARSRMHTAYAAKTRHRNRRGIR